MYFYVQTRVHLDQVEDLWYFIELEVVLEPEGHGQQIANNTKFFKDKLIEGACVHTVTWKIKKIKEWINE